MPGSGHRFSAKADRQASHVAASERAGGKSAGAARRIGYATVVSQGGGRKSARGRRSARR